MIEFRRLLDMAVPSFGNQMQGSPSACAAFRCLLDGDREGAEVRFQRLLDEDPRDPEALAGLAVCVAEETGRFLSATRLAKEAVRRAPRSPGGYYALGYINLLGSRLDEGYRYLMKAKHLAPRDPRVARGLAFYEAGLPPVICDLSRLHPVNRVLGGVRSYLRSPAHRVMALSLGAVGLWLAGSIIA